MNNSWTERVEHRINRWCEEGLGKVWVVAVSGGGDSVGLLRLLHRIAGPAGLRLSVAHLDHGVRGEAARQDAAFVAELAGSLGWPCDLGTWQPKRSSHFESDARRRRYAWLTEVARSRAATVVATAHTRDDQAETILHRIIRGTGPRGLGGMPFRRILATDPDLALVRPFLGISRHTIRAYLAALGQPFREDQTNVDLSRTRARIRHDLLPRIARDYNPKITEALVRLGALAVANQRAIEREVRSLGRGLIVGDSPDCVVLKHGALAAVPAFLRVEVLRRIWRRAGWPEGQMSARRWRQLAALVEHDDLPRIAVGAGVEVSTEQSLLILRRLAVSAPAAEDSFRNAQPIPLAVPGLTPVPWANCAIDARIDTGHEAARDETLDRDRVVEPLFVRAPAPGDRFAPLGMGGKSMPLADFFRGRRVLRHRRLDTPVICDQRGIIWVAGHRIADRVKLTEQTVQRLTLYLDQAPRDVSV
jgi:tRNA(Ile)-lysidine synthase